MNQSEKTAMEEGAETQRDLKKEFGMMLFHYFRHNPTTPDRKKVPELEISFGTIRNNRAITKMDYDEVVKHLYAAGFSTSNPRGVHMLRIKEEYIDPKSGENKISNLRAEIVGIDLIQEYCKTNSLQKIIDMPSTMFAEHEKLKFTKKSPAMTHDQKIIRPVQFPEFNFNVKFQTERDFYVDSPLAKSIISKWADSRKIFRHMNRVQFRHPNIPVLVDLSIVRSSRKVGRAQIPKYTIQEAGVFENEETYEIELELDNSMIGEYTPVFNTPKKVMDQLRKCIRMVLTAIQGSCYPIGKTEKNNILLEYMKVVHGKTFESRRIGPKDFVGPSSVTLGLENVAPVSPDSVIPNVRQKYCVTDKADGDRKLLYIGTNGRIYLIDTNMNVQFTGMLTEKKELFETIVDGEHILRDKNGKYINLFASFDVYYIRGISVRDMAFIKTDPESVDNKFRLVLLMRCIELLNPKSVVEEGQTSSLRIHCKQFFVPDETNTIFDCCRKVLTESVFEYNTDGLIFTPVEFGVGGDAPGRVGHLFKPRWIHSFKWKPAHFNTIDFLVSSSNDVDGKEEIHTILPDGSELGRAQTVMQYKVVNLKCGYSIREHGYANPFQDVIDGNVVTKEEEQNDNEYLPVPFQPTDPFDPNAHICNVKLIQDGVNRKYMRTEEGEFFEEGMIVEFRYDMSKKGGWRWVPLRVRYDKTAELRSGSRNFGNSFDVANSNWNSIHRPITVDMITTGANIPEYTGNEDVYYNSNKTSGFDTKSLKDFHNIYIKRRLITGVAKRNDTIIDFAVGKAGDLSKWVASHVSFVFGVDISKDNIENKKDGACARYLNTRKKFPKAMDAIFLHGNSGINIRSGDAFRTDKEKRIARAIFGNGPKDRTQLEEAVYKHHSIGKEGFSVSSCQFALHYFFENAKTLHSFLRNVADCTAIGGYFIGTCYDGAKVFRVLRDKVPGDSITIQHEGYKVFEITKRYTQSGFPENELSLGYSIDVYQESINKSFREYLVNIDYLIRLMDDYGFSVVPRNEAEHMGLPNGVGSFESMFNQMTREHKNSQDTDDDMFGSAMDMTEDEKFISFLNVYFVFRKTRTVDTAKITQLFDAEEYNEEVEDEQPINAIQKYIRAVQKHVKETMPETAAIPALPTFIHKVDHPKFVISEYEPVDDTEPEKAIPQNIEENVEKVHIEKAVPAAAIPEKINAEILPDAPLTIVRGEVKQVIRIPKRAIRIIPNKK